MLPVDLALRVNNPAAATSLMELRLSALREGTDVYESKSRRPELALFSGWDNDLMRCEVFKTLMQDSNHAGTQFNRNIFGLSFGLKNRLRFHFDSETCLNYSFMNIFFYRN